MLCGLWTTVEVVLLKPLRVNKRGPVLRKPDVEEARNAVMSINHHQREAVSVERTAGGSGIETQQRSDGALPSL